MLSETQHDYVAPRPGKGNDSGKRHVTLLHNVYYASGYVCATFYRSEVMYGRLVGNLERKGRGNMHGADLSGGKMIRA